MAEEQNKILLTALAQHASYIYRANTGAVNAIIKEFEKLSNSALRNIRDLFDDLTEAERQALSAGSYSTPRLVKIKEQFKEWQASTSTVLYDSFETGAVALATNESEYVATLAGETTAAAIAGEEIYKQAKKIPVTGGALVQELFQGLADTVRMNTERAIRQGITDGFTNQQIWREIKGSSDLPDEPSVMRSAKIEIDRVVRTARNHVGNVAYTDTFKALGYEYVKFVATLDGRTSKVCASRDGDVYPIDGSYKTPPLHPNCRSVLVGTDADGNLVGRRPFVMADKPVSEIPKDERKGVIGQVNSNTSFNDWFDKDATESFKQEWLGKTKYELYKKGGYSLDKFVDPLGREYTIAELRELDKKTFKELGL